MSELKQHPLSQAFPSMSADDFAALVEDIKTNGQREPVTVHEGMVLDGWHRYRACLKAGIKPLQFTFPADKDPVAFVLSENLHRRHLTPSQRAAAVVACTEWAPAKRPAKEEKRTPGVHLSTNAELAKAAQVHPTTIKDAKAAHKAGLTDAVKAGAMTAKEAAAVARGKPEPPSKATKREMPAAAPQADDDRAAELAHTVSELAQENEELRDKLAVESLMDSEEAKSQTAETIRELRAQVKTLGAELDAVKVSRDTYMRENAELKKQVTHWRKQADKAQKAAA